MAAIRIGFCFGAEVLSLPEYSAPFRSIDLLIFPELVHGGYAALAKGVAHAIGDPTLENFKAASKHYSLCCIAGSTRVVDTRGRSTNTSFAFSKGRLVHRYDKIHLFRPAGDDRYFSPGARMSTFVFLAHRRRVRAGVVICYDLRFPELMRGMALQGIDILCVPARWPAARDDAWRALLKARAIENQIFVAGCNATDEEGGYSYLFGPTGEQLFTNRNATDSRLHAVAIDLGQIRTAHKLHNNLADAVFLRNTRMPRRLTPPGRRH